MITVGEELEDYGVSGEEQGRVLCSFFGEFGGGMG